MLRMVLVFLIFAAPVSAGSCGYNQCWGAVGIGSGTIWGYSYGLPNESSALDRLYVECPLCENVYTFFNTCGAIAKDSNGAWGSGWGDTRELAEFYAVDTCYKYGTDCAPAVWACSQ